MPKVFITKEQQQLNHIYNFIIGESYAKKIRQTEISEELGITQQAYSYKLRNKALSLEDFVKILNLFGKDIEECIK